MDVLAAKDLEDWRFGRVPYLERAIQGSAVPVVEAAEMIVATTVDAHHACEQATGWRTGVRPSTPQGAESENRARSLFCGCPCTSWLLTRSLPCRTVKREQA